MQLLKKFPAFLWNPKVHYRTHNRPPIVPILGQPNSVHIPTSHLLEIHPNIFHPSTPRSPQWSLSIRFPHQTLYTPSHHPYAPHAQPISFTLFTYNKIVYLSGRHISTLQGYHQALQEDRSKSCIMFHCIVRSQMRTSFYPI